MNDTIVGMAHLYSRRYPSNIADEEDYIQDAMVGILEAGNKVQFPAQQTIAAKFAMKDAVYRYKSGPTLGPGTVRNILTAKKLHTEGHSVKEICEIMGVEKKSTVQEYLNTQLNFLSFTDLEALHQNSERKLDPNHICDRSDEAIKVDEYLEGLSQEDQEFLKLFGECRSVNELAQVTGISWYQTQKRVEELLDFIRTKYEYCD
jgi:DNA-directed RNA polymerase specialized sigma subunit